MNRLTILTVGVIAAIVVGLVAIGIGIAALERKQASGPRITTAHLEGEFTSLDSAIHADETTAAAENGKLNASLSKLVTCIPELMGYVNGLTPEVTAARTIILSPHAQLSTYCSAVFYPP